MQKTGEYARAVQLSTTLKQQIDDLVQLTAAAEQAKNAVVPTTTTTAKSTKGFTHD